jgi:hypothetical protein
MNVDFFIFWLEKLISLFFFIKIVDYTLFVKLELDKNKDIPFNKDEI